VIIFQQTKLVFAAASTSTSSSIFDFFPLLVEVV